MRGWLKMLALLTGEILPAAESNPVRPEPDILTLADQARQEWDSARAYFNSVTDPDLIDHAIFLLEAAEKKYVYLFKQARAQGVGQSPVRAVPPVRVTPVGTDF